jgi:hypothetical protein
VGPVQVAEISVGRYLFLVATFPAPIGACVKLEATRVTKTDTGDDDEVKILDV